MPNRAAGAAPKKKPAARKPGVAAAGGPVEAKRVRKPKLTRVEKSELTRNAIVQAAAEIVGEYGYAEASIARIMERAGFGHGTFYAYFESRAELFDQLLPLKGVEVLDLLHERVKGSANLVEMEYRAFLGFLEFAQEHPWFFRLLHEAEVAAPDAHRRHMDNIMARFRRALKRSYDRGELPGYEEKELDTLAYLLISARDYVYSQHVGRSADVSSALRDAVQTYRKFISFGLRGKA
ncbi:TetR family transcriptional regulator [Rhodopseudomonas thermotolerans]|uniref:TetR family transcriptional regulator n=2 Tax=Rhodopseudomonas TaxID=1073 RepID=A0A336JS87_9BRAD|nr:MULTISPECIES: TetR/AcrR family transcriptional regulator [Rhodopseudomonas]RED29070.1 TetR family transcriptional regulator [Rhodopseudomonas pentothenatexigens]REF92307.1 TetR family transcriptional regulator [Rhodopseudomonas thermotolerans]SSW92482.1 TetR family transcriptional regulator [Rhodopseudomonas pentothenatexigens]